MQTSDSLRHALVALREEAALSQSALAKHLQCAPSRISRIESGEISPSLEDAIEIAQAIRTPRSAGFAEYLTQDWRILPKPGFSHPSLQALRHAEAALQKLAELLADPDLRNAFVRQIESCGSSLRAAADYLIATDHPIVFFGSPGVGKTTAICTIANLRDHSREALNQQMALQTGSGRTTVCEVQVRNGGTYAVAIEPCTDGELRQHLYDFCDFLLERSRPDAKADQSQGSGISSEVERALRNMTGLTIRRTKEKDGSIRSEDLGVKLIEEIRAAGSADLDLKEKLRIRVFSLLNLPARNKTSETFPRTSSEEGLTWLSNTFRAVNMGRHPQFTLPQRIEVTVPSPLLGAETLDLRLIDTRGIDEPAAPRQDLQAYLDNPRAVLVLCSSFKDAPSAAMQAVIERSIEGGLKSALVQQGLLLVLPQDGEEEKVVDYQTGEPVESVLEGRNLREYQARSTTLSDLGVRDLPILFLDVRQAEDSEATKKRILEVVGGLREEMERQIQALTAIAEHLIENKENAEVQAVFEQVIRRLRVWINQHQDLPQPKSRPADALLEDIEGIRYASTLRASVNRLGDWIKFDFWHGIGYGLRSEVEARASTAVSELRAVLNNLLDDREMQPTHGYLQHFERLLGAAYKEFLIRVQELGKVAFTDDIKVRKEYWGKSQARWGQGPGYKGDIRQYTEEAFSGEDVRIRDVYVEQEVERFWIEMLHELAGHLEMSPEAPEVTEPLEILGEP